MFSILSDVMLHLAFNDLDMLFSSLLCFVSCDIVLQYVICCTVLYDLVLNQLALYFTL